MDAFSLAPLRDALEGIENQLARVADEMEAYNRHYKIGSYRVIAETRGGRWVDAVFNTISEAEAWADKRCEDSTASFFVERCSVPES